MTITRMIYLMAS